MEIQPQEQRVGEQMIPKSDISFRFSDLAQMTKYLALLMVVVQAEAQISNLSLVNSPLDEQNPVMSPDGKQLYFTVASNAQNSGGVDDHGDIWVSNLSPSGWGAPVRTPDVMNNVLHNVLAGFSADGSRMYLIGHYQPGGKPVTSQGLSVCKMTGTGWSAPQNIVIPYFKNKSHYQSGYISPDETVFVFSAESYSTFGAEDIYVSLKEGGKWSEPVSLGPVINTANQDVSPSLSQDGKKLYFASNGHDGFGSFDIFCADRLDESYKNWSAPRNMGKGFNTEGRELFYREFPGGRFLTSTLSSDGVGNIRFLPADTTEFLTPVLADTTSVAAGIVVAPDSTQAGAALTTTIAGKVINSKTSMPVHGATIVFHSAEHQATADAAKEGSYSVSLPGFGAYHIRIEAFGYIGRYETLELRAPLLKELEMNFSLQPVEVGTTVNLKSVLFVQSKPELLDGSFDELDMVVDFMKRNPSVEIELGGHTDNRGRHEQNMKLSRDRVNVVKEYLVKQGIEEKRITGRGYGGTKPITDNEAEETRAMNRRVEFTIVKE
jgi:OOP family OmpA-OmpF porin